MNDYLKHYGVLGMKWGVRRYQNSDGTLNPTGKKRYAAKDTDSRVTKKVKKDLSQMTNQQFRKKYRVSNTRYMKRVDRYGDPYMNSPLTKIGKKMDAEAKKNKERYANKAKKNKNKLNKLTEARVQKLLEKSEVKYKKLAVLAKKREEKAKIKRGKKKAKEIVKKFGDKYPVSVDKKGMVTIKVGDDIWKVGY